MLAKFVPSVLILAISFVPTALGRNGAPRAPTEGAKVKPVDQLPVRHVQKLDMEKVATEDEQARLNFEAPRFAVNEKVDITPTTHGDWEDNGTLWRFTFEADSDSCKSLFFGFSEFMLTDEMDLFIYDADSVVVDENGDVVDETLIAHYTSENNNDEKHQLWTAPLPSCHVVMELDLEQPVLAEDIMLTLSVIAQGYKDVGTHGHNRELSGDCNRDVVCSEGDDWRDEIAAVGLMIFSTGGNTYSCTGTMLNNVEGDKRNLFLSARHCISEQGEADTLNVYWNYETTSCQRDPPNGSLSQKQTVTGATLLAQHGGSDVVLLELKSDPKDEWKVAYAGWDKTPAGSTTQGVVAIHHPAGDEKRISFENEGTTTTDYLGNNVGASKTHIRVEDWDSGTTEPGSSGSALFNLNHRVIGQLHGGYAACGNDDADWYGRLSVSWVNAGLAQYLDPNGRGTSFVNTLPHGGVSNPPTPPSGEYCGDGSIGDGEVCDGSDVPQTTCFNEGFLPGVGVIGCLSDCSGIDTSKCDIVDDAISGNSGDTLVEGSVTIDYPISKITFELFGGSGDADLYTRFGVAPTLQNFDCRPYTAGNDEECVVDNNPSQGTYHYMVHAYGGVSGATLQIMAEPASNNGDQICGNGVIEGSEVCDGQNVPSGTTCNDVNSDFLAGEGQLGGCLSNCLGYDTTKCRSVIHEKLNKSKSQGKSVGDSVTIGAGVPISYIRFEAYGASSGNPDLHVRLDEKPTKKKFDCRPQLSGQANEVCSSDDAANSIPAQADTTYYYKVIATTDFEDVSIRVVADGEQK